MVSKEDPIHSRATMNRSVTVKRRVSFHAEPFVKIVGKSSAITNQEAAEGKRMVWYQREDFASFYREQLQTVRALKNAQGDITCLDPSEYYLRGLEEKIFTRYGRERRIKQVKGIRMILAVQAEQRRTGVQNPEGIKSLSMLVSKVSRDHAIEMAELDARAARPPIKNNGKRVSLVFHESAPKRQSV